MTWYNGNLPSLLFAIWQILIAYTGYDYGPFFPLEMAQPLYRDLLDLLEQAETQTGSHLSIAELLTAKFSERYPHIKIGRPSRFLETVKRINGPILSGKLAEKEKREYLERKWTPRIRNPSKGL